MLVNDFIRDLSVGELKNMAYSGNGTGLVARKDQVALLRYVNDALNKLYARYALSTKDILLETQTGVTIYHLLPQFAETQAATSPEPVQYIKDLSREPFTGDVLRILEVYNGAGMRVPLNDENQELSVFTPEYNMLQIPYAVGGELWTVVYKAKHQTLTETHLNTRMTVPPSLLPSLRSYVAYKVYCDVGTQEALVRAQQYLQRYELETQEIELTNMVNNSVVPTNLKLEIGGWV